MGNQDFSVRYKLTLMRSYLKMPFDKELQGNSVDSNDNGEVSLEPEATKNQNGNCNKVFKVLTKNHFT